jgi:hypothetical protein
MWCICVFSDDTDEIVGCDSCGISVHEACYGIQVRQIYVSQRVALLLVLQKQFIAYSHLIQPRQRGRFFDLIVW